MQVSEYKSLFVVEEQHWWFRSLHNYLLRYLSDRPAQPDAQKALDIGCGTGGLLAKLSAQGYESFGLDYSRAALTFARQRQTGNLLQGSANELPFKEQFDLVTCVDVLEVDTADPAKVVEGAVCSLKPGGLGIFVMAAHQWLLSEHDRAVSSVRRFSLAQMRALFAEQPVRVLHSSYFFFLLFPLLVIRKLLNPPRGDSTGDATVSDVSLPPAVINSLLHALSSIEGLLLPAVSLPWGSSAFVMVEKQ